MRLLFRNLPLRYITALSSDLKPDIDLEFVKFDEGSSGVLAWFLATADAVVKSLGVSATACAAEIDRIDGEERWNSRKIIAARLTADDPIKKFATATAKLRQRMLPQPTHLSMSIELSDFPDGLTMPLLGSEPADLVFQIALFVQHARSVPLIQASGLSDHRLEILQDASIKVLSREKQSLDFRTRIRQLKDLEYGPMEQASTAYRNLRTQSMPRSSAERLST